MKRNKKYTKIIKLLFIFALLFLIGKLEINKLNVTKVKINDSVEMIYTNKKYFNLEANNNEEIDQNKNEVATINEKEKQKQKVETKKENKTTSKNTTSITKNPQKKADNKKLDTQTTTKKEEPKKEEKVLETLKGSLAGYGPDCYGCTSKRTASGQYIGEGNIYYTDKEYGKVRILAGDSKYPFGTIVKISNTGYDDNSPIYAVVLDIGGGVGIGKQFLFDLLYKTEKDALKYGSKKNVTFEILRLGYKK